MCNKDYIRKEKSKRFSEWWCSRNAIQAPQNKEDRHQIESHQLIGFWLGLFSSMIHRFPWEVLSSLFDSCMTRKRGPGITLNNLPEDRPDNDNSLNFRLICIAMTAAFVAQAMLLVAIPVYALDLDASPLELGAIFAAPAVLPLFFAIPMGGFVTRRGGRLSIIVGALTAAVGVCLILVFPSIIGLLAAQLLIGIAQMQMVLAAQTVVSSLGTCKTLENYFGWYTTWLSGGQVLGPLLAGGLIDLYGTAEPAFYVMALLSVAGAFLALGLVGDARQGRSTSRAVSGFRAQGRLLKTCRGVQVSIAVTMAAMFALTAHGSYLPVYLDGLGMEASTIGFLVSLRAIASMLVRPFTSRIISILGGRETTVLVSVAAMTIGLAFTGSVHTVVILGILSALVGIGAGLSQPLSMVLLAESVNSEQRSGALGMRLMGNRAVKLVAPLVFGAVFAAAGFGVAFMVGGVIVGVCGILLFWIVRRLGAVAER